jgi:hypothetical protein
MWVLTSLGWVAFGSSVVADVRASGELAELKDISAPFRTVFPKRSKALALLFDKAPLSPVELAPLLVNICPVVPVILCI